MIHVRIDGLAQVQRALKDLGEKTHNRIVTSSLTRAGTAMNTMADKAVRSELNLKKADTRQVIKLRKPTKRIPEATLFISHAPIRLMHYGGKAITFKKKFGGGKGVTVKVKPKGGRKLVQGGFILRTKHGRALIVRRVGRERLPIEKLFGPEPYQVIKKQNLEPKIAKRGQEVFISRFAHEWKREVEKAAARSRAS